MKKLVFMAVIVMTILAGCDSKPESVSEPITKTPTEAELVGYWRQAAYWESSHPLFFEIEEGGAVYRISGVVFATDTTAWSRIHNGTISYGDEVRYTEDGDNNEYICSLSEDGTTFYGERSEENVNVRIKWIRLSKEEYDALGVDYNQGGAIWFPRENNGNEE